MNPIVSIVVTAFDRVESLRELLDALNDQTLSEKDFEVIIADDSAHLRTGEKAQENTETRYSTSLVKTGLPFEVNGVSVARNKGIKAAKGQIIISIDDDCIPNRYFIEEHLKFHRRGYPLIVLGHRSERREKLKERRPVPVNENKAVSELIGGTADLLAFGNFMTGNLSFPRAMVLKEGLFNEDFAQPGEHGWEDIELGYRLWRRGYPTCFSRNALVYRPATEKEKEDGRNAGGSIQKAHHRLLDIHPLIPWVHQLLDSHRRKKFHIAEETAKNILRDDPHNVGALALLGDIHLQLGRFPKATECFGAALAMNPSNPLFLEQIGETLYHQDEKEEALQFFASALSLDPNRTRSLYFLAHLKDLCPKIGLGELVERKIHIELGGGIFPTKIRDEGHDDFINVDAMTWQTVDVVQDLGELIPFPDSSIANIFSREMIEHLPYRTLPTFIQECFRVLEPGGDMYLCCPDFERIVVLYEMKCDCLVGGVAQPHCPNCHGRAEISEDYWRANLLGNQKDYGDGGINDTHKNQITFPYLKKLLEKAGFIGIQRDHSNRFYEEYKKNIKLSVQCKKPRPQKQWEGLTG